LFTAPMIICILIWYDSTIISSMIIVIPSLVIVYRNDMNRVDSACTELGHLMNRKWLILGPFSLHSVGLWLYHLELFFFELGNLHPIIHLHPWKLATYDPDSILQPSAAFMPQAVGMSRISREAAGPVTLQVAHMLLEIRYPCFGELLWDSWKKTPTSLEHVAICLKTTNWMVDEVSNLPISILASMRLKAFVCVADQRPADFGTSSSNDLNARLRAPEGDSQSAPGGVIIDHHDPYLGFS
jgi:hypothetical protein